MQYYSLIKSNEVTDICYDMDKPKKRLSEKRSHMVWFNLCEIYRISKSIEAESRADLREGWMRSDCLMDIGFSFGVI